LSRRQAPAPPAARVDLRGPAMDLRVEGLPPDTRVDCQTHGATVVFPLRKAVVEAVVMGREALVNRTRWMLLPAGRRLRLIGRSHGARVLVATAHPALIAKTAGLYAHVGFEAERFARWLQAPQLLPRTTWVDEIVQRYLFERQVCGGHENDATRFLEAEIIKEAYYLLRDREAGADRASTVQVHSPRVERALGHIEAHLFEPTQVARLARSVGASESTLLRAFKKELGCTPSVYWTRRRLDEALVLLESGHHSVAEVAASVGYENPSAFAAAFNRRFGQRPSSLFPR
jgi:AraC-like DNA-binding protein